MKLTIVYDNKLYRKDIGLKSDWGFSCLIETKHNVILFDTGTNGKILLENMKILGIDPHCINKIVISHEHHDHNGGLKALTPFLCNIELYRLAKESPTENMHLISVERSWDITEGVYTTGIIKGNIDEQSLVLKGEKGWYVLTGCSHPGLEKILHIARHIGDVVGIIGGLHGFKNFSVLEGLDLICPCHCTAYKKEIRMAFPNFYSDCGVGKIIDLDEEI